MPRLLTFLIAILICAPSFAQQKECTFFSEEAANSLVADLTNAKSCNAAATHLHECAWGSSADVGFSGIVIRKCEASFKGKLSPEAKHHYFTELDLCRYEYARQDGTLYQSEAALCMVDAAVAVNPIAPVPPPARASFPCEKAHSPLELAICSDPKLGRADIVLGRVYAGLLKWSAAADKSVIIADEKKWLANLPAKCGLSSAVQSQKTLACLIEEFELRFTFLDTCNIGPALDCLQNP